MREGNNVLYVCVRETERDQSRSFNNLAKQTN